MIYLLVATVINIVLDIVFVSQFHMGVAGVRITRYEVHQSMIESGVFSISSSGLERTAPRIIIMMEEIAVSVTQFPIVIESSFLCFAPKYCDTMTPAPTEIPTNRTRSRFKMGAFSVLY